MSSISAARMQNIYSDLSTSISSSVRNIRFKQAENFQPQTVQSSETNNIFSSFSLNNYAVSYLEPQALYNLHRAQEDENAGRLNDRRRQQQVSDEAGQNGTDAVNDNVQNAPAVSFMEELQNSQSFPDAKVVAAVYNQSGGKAAVFENIGSGGFAMGEVKYANDAYGFSYRLTNIENDVRIEFMHKYNRSFDYRV